PGARGDVPSVPPRRSADLAEARRALMDQVAGVRQQVEAAVRPVLYQLSQQESVARQQAEAVLAQAQQGFQGRVTELQKTAAAVRSEEHTSELQSRENLVCR